MLMCVVDRLGGGWEMGLPSRWGLLVSWRGMVCNLPARQDILFKEGVGG